MNFSLLLVLRPQKEDRRRGNRREKFLGWPRKHHFVNLDPSVQVFRRRSAFWGKTLHEFQANNLLLFQILYTNIFSKNNGKCNL